MSPTDKVGRILRVAVLGGFSWIAPSSTLDVTVKGVKVGELTVVQTNQTNGVSVSVNIDGDFLKTNQAPGGQLMLNAAAPLGTTFMQALTFNTSLNQKIFFPSDHTAQNPTTLTGTWSDPPVDGYVLFNGSKQLFPDPRPYYSTITPSGDTGDIPPDNYAGPHQYSDTPTIPWGNLNANTFGIANLLNGLNGSIQFETALVGVCEEPPIAQARTGPYKVCVLKDFTWGLNFTYVGPNGGRPTGTYAAADYVSSLRALEFSNDVSETFKTAFDMSGPNGHVEWGVTFVKADNVPEPGTLAMTILAAVAAAAWMRRAALK
jgi:hypothetical protein